MPRPAKKALGKNGENVAASFLRANGYRILASQWRGERYELDLIAEKSGALVFIEVKTVSDETMGPPEYKIDSQKQKRIIQAAQEYLASIDSFYIDIRFDAILIKWSDKKPPEIRHLESAFTSDS